MLPGRILKILAESKLVAGADKVIVAVSGGCDSVALLHILLQVRSALKVELHVASLDHGLRASAGHDDAAFVGGLAATWSLPHSLEQVDVAQLAADWGMGIEAAARRARYDFLARVARRAGCSIVVAGHHADDQAETVLLNIVRGSGLRGLGGMRLVSPLPYHPDLQLIRPLLTTAKAELEQYCKVHKLAYRHDETNRDTRYARNFLRHDIMRRLTRLNPDAVGALNRLAEAAATDEQFVDSQLEELATRAVHDWEDGCRINLAHFRQAHPALQRRLLRRAFCRLAGPGATLTHERTLDLVEFCRNARTGASRDIGGALVLRVDYGEIRIQRRGGQEPASADYRLIPRDTDCLVRPREGLDLGTLSIVVGAAPGDCDQGAVLPLPTGCELRLRTRRAGDRFKPKGMGGRSRKLKDWMIDRKIPQRLRDQIPLLCADGAIVAICLGATWQLAELDAIAGTADATTVVCLE